MAKMHLGATGSIFQRAQALRAAETVAEKLLWKRLSNNQLGVKFRRQHPVLNYIVDFYCHSRKLVIELDGSVHDLPEQRFHDANRMLALSSHGLKVIRFTNEDVIDSIDRVVMEIETCIYPDHK
jgi:cyclase